MSASTSRPSLRALMFSISGSLTAVSVMDPPRERRTRGRTLPGLDPNVKTSDTVCRPFASARAHGRIGSVAERPSSPSRADDLAHELQVEIVTGRIPLGTRLRQEDLAARYGVSRTPIREALRQLQAIGLVEQLGHRGALVRSFSPDECRNIFLVRAELEGLAAERAAGRLTSYDNADLDTAQALLRAGAARYAAIPVSDERGRLIAP